MTAAVAALHPGTHLGFERVDGVIPGRGQHLVDDLGRAGGWSVGWQLEYDLSAGWSVIVRPGKAR